MDKRQIAIIVVLVWVMVLGSAAFGDIYETEGPWDFDDKIDMWTLQTCVGDIELDTIGIGQGCPLTYRHDISDDYAIPAEHLVTEAYLQLDFTNDWTDGTGMFWCFRWHRYDFREFVRLAYDGSDFVDIGEQDAGQYELALGIDWLNDDGLLDVTIEVSNPLGTAIAWLDHSRLFGNVAAVPVPVPVPGAAFLGVLGLGAAGLRLRQRV